ncbi:uncharacterized protein LOC111591890 [Drosophila hydei]|uniref:Uncharacterized protein LOC111591890 n=1 Tax=Drosophila hydei TaxID=7224 RepID=A0A6J1L655_DROHY|nr:uncharacterized protein LOC111591890 [Drosophila hydei]
MKSLNVFILGLIGLALVFEAVDAYCVLETHFPKPQIITHFGSKHWLTEATTISRDNYESIDLYCSKGFSINSNVEYNLLNEQKRINLTCYGDEFHTLWQSEEIQIVNLKCMDNQIYPMYESSTSMAACNEYMSLVVGQTFGEYGSIKSVAICYDIVKQQLKYVSYTAYPPKIKLIEQSEVGQLNHLGLDIEVIYSKNLFKSFSSLNIHEAFLKDKHLKTLFGSDTFEYANLIQDDALRSDLDQFQDMLSIVWLRALRNGNWRHFLNALRDASADAKYDVNVGVSGTIVMPTLHACDDNRTLSIELDSGDTVNVPAHIWAHVRPVEPTVNGTDEFVLVAHNSPFFTTRERNGLCESICHEVPWLQKSLFSRLRHYPVYGLVQCCKVIDVQHKLDHFPKLLTPMPELGLNPEIPVSTTTERAVNSL